MRKIPFAQNTTARTRVDLALGLLVVSRVFSVFQMAVLLHKKNEKSLGRRLYTVTRLYSQPDYSPNIHVAGTDKITQPKMWIFSQSHPFTLSSLFFCPVGALLCAPSGAKVLHGGMQICTQSNISSFFCHYSLETGYF